MGPNATVDDFLNPSLYDSLRETIDVVKQAVKDTGVSPLTPIWIGIVNVLFFLICILSWI